MARAFPAVRASWDPLVPCPPPVWDPAFVPQVFAPQVFAPRESRVLWGREDLRRG